MNLLELTAPIRKALAAAIATAVVVALSKVVDVPSTFGPAVEVVAGGLLTAGAVWVTRNRPAKP